MGVGPILPQDLPLEARLELNEMSIALTAPQAGYNR